MNPSIPTRRATLAGLAAALVAGQAQAAGLSPEDQALVDKAVATLQALTSAKGRFVQTDSRGTVTQGTIYLQRPGKARFAYDPPSGLTVVSDGNFVSIADRRLKTFDRYPLKTTPLALFLAREIRLDRGVVVSRVSRLADGFSITARDGKKETRGTITLTFSNAPALIGWAITDAQGATTRVRLTGLQNTPGLDRALFAMKDTRPQGRRPGT